MGFGMYQRLDSYVLLEIAQCTGGMFSHIKDAANVGTIFVNGISNIMTTAVNDAKLTVKFADPNFAANIENKMAGFLPVKLQGNQL